MGRPPAAEVLGSHVVILAALLSLLWAPCSGWFEDIKPRISRDSVLENVQRFRGNESHVDHFKLLVRDGKYLIVGARNAVYNLTLDRLSQKEKLEWYSNPEDVTMCQLKGKKEEDCQNYVRILAKNNSDELLICGTNAYKPECRIYAYEDSQYVVRSNFSGQGRCPYDPAHNSTAVFADGQLYVATVSDFSGTDPLIYRDFLRTEQADLKQLNAPSFISSMEYKEYVFYFFRETALEYINCGKAIHSRVARVCKNDKGGPDKFSSKWTSFLKARLNCSVPGEFPFYFDEIQATSSIVRGVHNGAEIDLVYAVFTTNRNSIGGSAICAYRMRDILNTFEGQFKDQETMNSNWLPIPSKKVPEPRPGQCVENSPTLTEAVLNFVQSHPLMDEAVPSTSGAPLYTKVSMSYRFTGIAVDPRVRAVDESKYDVIFVGTDTGLLLKVVDVGLKRSQLVVVEQLKLFGKTHQTDKNTSRKNTSIRNILITESSEDSEGKLVIVTDEEVLSLQLQRCSENARTCSSCVQLQDPYCAWDGKNCIAVPFKRSKNVELIQNVAEGVSDKCTGPGEQFLVYVDKEPSGDSKFSERSNLHTSFYSYKNFKSEATRAVVSSSENQYPYYIFIIVVSLSIVIGFLVGFVFGYMYARKRRLGDAKYSDKFSEYSSIQRKTDIRKCKDHSIPNNLTNNLMNCKTDNLKAVVGAFDSSTPKKTKKTYI